MGKYKDLTGKKFGRLTVIKDAGRNTNSKVLWECSCDCGNTLVAVAGHILNGNTKSCGCFQKERASNSSTKHSMSKTKEYRAWVSIKQRVLNNDNPDYNIYGNLGMEESWKNDFMAFYNHIGPCPDDGKKYSVDRIDTSRGYFPLNIRWATDEVQARNKIKSTRNTSGFTGAFWVVDKINNATRAVANWHDKHMKNVTKSFSVKKYGLLEAFALACKTREEAIENLKKEGVEYGSQHGK